MLMITCPVTGTEQFVDLTRVVAVVNHPTHIGVHVACPCGQVHEHRTGRRWESTHRHGADQVPPPRPARELVNA